MKNSGYCVLITIGCGYFGTTANQRKIRYLGCFDLPVVVV